MLAELHAVSVILRAAKRTVVQAWQDRSTTAATKETKGQFNELMRDEHLLKICELFAAVRMGKLAVMFIVVEHVYRTVCATWASVGKAKVGVFRESEEQLLVEFSEAGTTFNS